MALSARRKLIMAAIEAVYGTAVATAAADAVLVHDPSLTPVTGGTADRELVRSYYGASEQIPVNTHQQIEFGVELAGPGGFDPLTEAITAPAWGKLLRACGFAESIEKKIAADPHKNIVQYTPITGAEPSLTVRGNWDGQQHVLAGCRGSVALSLAAADIPRLRFTLTGLWQKPTSVAAIAGQYGAWKAPRPGSTRDTPTVSLFGQAGLKMRSFELDLAVEVVHREVIGAANEVVIVDRDPSGTIVLDMSPLSAWNPFDLAASGSVGALRIVHGGPDTVANAGKLVGIDCPRIQIGEPTYGDDSGIQQVSIPFRAAPNSGNDEITVSVR